MKAGRLGIKRRQLGVTQAELASRLGVDYRTIKSIEDETIGLDTETYNRIDSTINEVKAEKSALLEAVA